MHGLERITNALNHVSPCGGVADHTALASSEIPGLPKLTEIRLRRFAATFNTVEVYEVGTIVAFQIRCGKYRNAVRLRL